jgi:hypothetical protein
MTERDLHFNDLRGTAATKFYVAGFSMREIAETLAWEEESIEKIIRRYVGRSAAIKARIAKLREAKECTNPAKPPIKPSLRVRLSPWSGRRESNPRMQLGKLPFYH